MPEKMEWAAIDLIEPCIGKTKEFLFPINWIIWLKLAFVALLAGYSGGGIPSFNFQVPGGQETGVNQMLGVMGQYWSMILFFIILGVVLGFIFAYLRSVFRFILVESVVNKEVFIGKSFSKNAGLAFSYFLFMVIMSLLFLVVIGIMSIPFITTAISAGPNLNMAMLGVGYMVTVGITALVIGLIMALISFVVNNFVIIDMYFKRIGVLSSLGRVWKVIKNDWKQFLVFFFMKIVLNIAALIIAMILLVIVLFVFALIGGLIFLIGFAITAASPVMIVPMIIIGAILGFIWFLLWIYAVAIVVLPIDVFFVNYRIEFMKEINKRNKKVLK